MKFHEGQHVWLAPFKDDPDPRNWSARQMATIDEYDKDCTAATICEAYRDRPSDVDGLREFHPNQIEGAAVYMVTQCGVHHELGFGLAVHTLAEAKDQVIALDKAWLKWSETGKKHEDKFYQLAIDHYEGCDIYVELDGIEYWFTEDDEWEEHC